MDRSRLLCLLLLAPALVAGEPSFVGQSAKWYNSNYESVQRVLRSRNDPNVVPYIQAIGSLYEFREGSIGAEVSPAIGVALTYHPALMLSWFQAHPTVFDQWLERVQVDLLTDYTGTEAKHLERLRVKLVASLRKFESESREALLCELSVRARKQIEFVNVKGIE